MIFGATPSCLITTGTRSARAIGPVVNSAEGSNWEDVARQIARHREWEFEDYSDGDGIE